MDIYHTGKEEANDDHKFVNERLLEVAVPEDPGDGRVITLEDCLETYFNNRIEVRRFLERRITLQPLRSIESMNSSKERLFDMDFKKIEESLTIKPVVAGSQITPVSSLEAHPRSPSIVKEYFVSEKCDSSGLSPSVERESDRPRRKRAGSLRKVLCPCQKLRPSIIAERGLLGDFDACLAILLTHS